MGFTIHIGGGHHNDHYHRRSTRSTSHNSGMSKAGAIILTIMGIVFLSAACIMGYTEYNTAKYRVPTQAVVVDVEKYTERDTYYDTDGYRRTDIETYTYTYVKYTVDGVEYDRVLLPDKSLNVSIGDTVSIYYDMRDPSKVMNSAFTTYILVGMAGVAGIVTLIFGIVLLTKYAKRSREDVSSNDSPTNIDIGSSDSLDI